MRKSMIAGVSFLVIALGVLAQAQGQPAAKATVITIEDLDCPVCAKGVEKAVAEVSGVAEVKTDVDKMTATVTAKTDKGPSPKALWEAVEKAGFKPTKLEGPSGTFTTKPAA